MPRGTSFGRKLWAVISRPRKRPSSPSASVRRRVPAGCREGSAGGAEVRHSPRQAGAGKNRARLPVNLALSRIQADLRGGNDLDRVSAGWAVVRVEKECRILTVIYLHVTHGPQRNLSLAAGLAPKRPQTPPHEAFKKHFRPDSARIRFWR